MAMLVPGDVESLVLLQDSAPQEEGDDDRGSNEPLWECGKIYHSAEMYRNGPNANCCHTLLERLGFGVQVVFYTLLVVYRDFGEEEETPIPIEHGSQLWDVLAATVSYAYGLDWKRADAVVRWVLERKGSGGNSVGAEQGTRHPANCTEEFEMENGEARGGHKVPNLILQAQFKLLETRVGLMASPLPDYSRETTLISVVAGLRVAPTQRAADQFLKNCATQEGWSKEIKFRVRWAWAKAVGYPRERGSREEGDNRLNMWWPWGAQNERGRVGGMHPIPKEIRIVPLLEQM